MNLDIATIGTNVASLIAGAFGTYMAQRRMHLHPLQIRYAELQAAHTALQQENADLRSDAKSEKVESQAKVAEFQTQIAELKAHIEQHQSKVAVLNRFSIDVATGDFVENGIHFCPRCFHQSGDALTVIQMAKISAFQWQCPVCHQPRRVTTIPTGGR